MGSLGYRLWIWSMTSKPSMPESARRAGSFLKVSGIRIERRDEPQIIEHPGSEANGHPPHLVEGLVDQFTHGQGSFRGPGIERLEALPDPHQVIFFLPSRRLFAGEDVFIGFSELSFQGSNRRLDNGDPERPGIVFAIDGVAAVDAPFCRGDA